MKDSLRWDCLGHGASDGENWLVVVLEKMRSTVYACIIYIYDYICMCMHVRHAWMDGCMDVCMDVCMGVCMYVHIADCINKYTY